MIIHHGILGEEAVRGKALQQLLSGLAAQVMDLAAGALEAAVEDVEEADGVAFFESLVGGAGVEGGDDARALVADRYGLSGVLGQRHHV